MSTAVNLRPASCRHTSNPMLRFAPVLFCNQRLHSVMGTMMRTVSILVPLLSCCAFAQIEEATTLNGSTCDVAPGDVIVKFKAADHIKLSASQRTSVLKQLEKTHDATITPLGGVQFMHHLKSRSKHANDVIKELRKRSDVEYAEPNCTTAKPIDFVPNDPYFVNNSLTLQPQWHLANQDYGGTGSTADIGAEKAWNITKGSQSFQLALSDWDIDCSHPDLTANCWASSGDFSITLNGTTYHCPGGTIGFDTAPARYGCGAQVSAGRNYHGTMVLGAMAAVGNNRIGVSGVMQTASVVAIRVGNAGGSTSTQNQIDSLEAARQMKIHGVANIRALNLSWSNRAAYSQALTDEMKALGDADILLVTGAANNSKDNDASPIYPQSETASVGCSAATGNCPLSNLLTLGSIQDNGSRSTWANYGATSVQAAAPGYKIVSTCLAGASNPVTFQTCPAYATGNSYQFDNGTSFSAPIGVGIAGLVMAACPLVTTYSQVKNILLSTTKAESTLRGYTVTGGYLRADNALAACVRE